MKKKYAKAQIDYLAAKEHFLQISQQADKKVNELRESGVEIKQEEMEEVLERVGLHRAFNELIQAENILINWSHTAIKNEPEFKDKRKSFEALYEKVKTDQSARSTLISLAMKLSLEKV
jgi:hypothetical protein